MSKEQTSGKSRSASPQRPSGEEAARNPLLRDDAEKRGSLVQLREQYVEAQKLVSSDEPYANLEWILGARRNVTQDPLSLESKTIELVALWLQDLAVEIGRRLPPSPSVGLDAPAASDRARELVAQSLREATQRFLLAFQPSDTETARRTRE